MERGYEGGRAGLLPTFKIQGIELEGYFDVCFLNNKWCTQQIVIEEMAISKEDYEKLNQALKNKTEVEIECTHNPEEKAKHTPSLAHGEGKAKITSLKYDKTRNLLKGIKFELTEWTQKP
jgi:hypothetical protein